MSITTFHTVLTTHPALCWFDPISLAFCGPWRLHAAPCGCTGPLPSSFTPACASLPFMAATLSFFAIWRNHFQRLYVSLLLPVAPCFFFKNVSSSVSPGCYTAALVVWILLEHWHIKVVLCFRRYCWFSCYEATGNVSQKRIRIQSQCTASLCVKNLLHKLMFWHIKSCSVFLFRGMR